MTRTEHVAWWITLCATLPRTRRAKPGWLSTVGLARTLMAIGRAGSMSRPSSRSTPVQAESATAPFEDSSCWSRRPAEQRTTRRDLCYLPLMQSLTCRPLMRSLDAPSVDAISRWFSARPLRVNVDVATRRLRAVRPNGSIVSDIRTPGHGPWQRCEHADGRKLVRRRVLVRDVGEVKQRGPRPQGWILRSEEAEPLSLDWKAKAAPVEPPGGSRAGSVRPCLRSMAIPATVTVPDRVPTNRSGTRRKNRLPTGVLARVETRPAATRRSSANSRGSARQLCVRRRKVRIRTDADE